MLGISFSELVIACGVAFLVMKPRDLRRVAYWYRFVLKSFMELKGIAQDTIDGINKDWEEDEGKSTNYVIDTDTAVHEVYDASNFKFRDMAENKCICTKNDVAL